MPIGDKHLLRTCRSEVSLPGVWATTMCEHNLGVHVQLEAAQVGLPLLVSWRVRIVHDNRNVILNPNT